MLGSEVNDDVANVMVSQMLYLASADPDKDITIYINSPGGSVQAGLAIFDTMQYIPCDVNTVCFGMAASMGAFLLSSGTKGKRRSLPNSRIMIHQPLGGSQGDVRSNSIYPSMLTHVHSCIYRLLTWRLSPNLCFILRRLSILISLHSVTSLSTRFVWIPIVIFI
jgi:ATP-dependent Clp protease protease subunit